MSDVVTVEERAVDENPRAVAGSNNPPGPIDDARTAWTALAAYCKDNPVIETGETARAAKLVLDRGKIMLEEVTAARAAEVDPLRVIWMAAREKYAGAIDHLTKVVDLLEDRIKVFLRAEEDRRAAEAIKAVELAQAAEKAAREAERAEEEAIANAKVGEIVDVAAASVAADEKFAAYEKADRQAVIALRDSAARLGGGFKRSLSLRNKKVAVLDDWQKAITAIGLTEDIQAAILKSAKAYKSIHNRYPEGVSEKEVRE